MNKKYMDLPIIDSHAHHMEGIDGIDRLLGLKESFGFHAMNVLSIPMFKGMTQDLKCMLYKVMYPDQCYIFGGLHHSLPGVVNKKAEYRAHAERLMRMGFDGMKMLEGKPDMRLALGKPLDHEDFDDYYQYLEAEKIPVIFHVADPETFWDEKTIPEWAKSAGWFYGNGRYPSKETFYREIDGILTKFPQLHMIFAHFYFLSADLERAGELFERWPNISFDLTPGTEMYVNFAQKTEKTRDFFHKYQDRLLFGTDNYDTTDQTELENIHRTVNLIRSFLETEGEFQVWDGKFKGICLEREVLEKIYFKNFQCYAGAAPKKPDIRLALEECGRMAGFALQSPDKEEILAEIDGIREILSPWGG